MALRWTSALALGVAEIDAQHQELFRRFERLEDAILAHDRSEAARLLDYLRDHVREHFATEEVLMRAVGYPRLAEHGAEHGAFAAEIAKLEIARERDGTTATLVLKLDQDLGGWLRDHIYTSDVALARFVQARRWARGGDAPREGPDITRGK
jgi:hemerythrin